MSKVIFQVVDQDMSRIHKVTHKLTSLILLSFNSKPNLIKISYQREMKVTHLMFIDRILNRFIKALIAMTIKPKLTVSLETLIHLTCHQLILSPKITFLISNMVIISSHNSKNQEEDLSQQMFLMDSKLILILVILLTSTINSNYSTTSRTYQDSKTTKLRDLITKIKEYNLLLTNLHNSSILRINLFIQVHSLSVLLLNKPR